MHFGFPLAEREGYLDLEDVAFTGKTRMSPNKKIQKPLRRGVSFVEVLVCLVAIALLIAIGIPAVQVARESARTSQCRYRLAQIGVGLESYHATNKTFPVAAVWKRGPLSSLALHTTKRIDLVTYDNWVLALLPHLDRGRLASQWRADRPIADTANSSLRTTWLEAMTCPSDTYNRRDNPYRFSIKHSSASPIEFARGNYGLNGGTHNGISNPASTMAPQGDHPTLVLDEERGEFRYLGTGIGGINWSLSRNELTNGQSTLIAVDELRAGIDPLDPRGVWSFGQIGGSMTWAHGVNGDAFGPNNQWSRSDDIQGCAELHRRLGTDALTAAKMPCVNYIDTNQQVAARSQHPGGVHSLFADGQVRFLSDAIDPGLWHVLHSREAPGAAFSDDWKTLLTKANDLAEARRSPMTRGPGDSAIRNPLPDVRGSENSGTLANSLGMEFVLVPAGEFEMGVPDRGFGEAPPETPAHRVRIANPYLLGRTEVTQQQFETVLKRNPSHHTAAVTSAATTAEFPVEQVSWDDTQAFCDGLSALAAERTAGRRYRLPTEAEWEYACRSGSHEPHFLPSQFEAATTGEAAGVAPPLDVGPVGRFPPNAFGLCDMRGNVWEWCHDWFDRDYYVRSPLADPQGLGTGYLKVVRGSDWIFVGEPCMINYPIMPPWKRSPFVGFRVVCELR